MPRLNLLAFTTGVLLAHAALVASGHAAPPDGERPLFNHAAHAERACVDCHRFAGDGRRRSPAPGGGHRPCIDCHGDRWRGSATWTAFCLTCHALDGRGRPRSARFWSPRPRAKADSWLAHFDHHAHQGHAAARRGTGGDDPKACATCHAGPDRSDRFTRPGHPACGECHAEPDGAAPSMAQCFGCHVDRGEAVIAPAASAVEHPYRMTAGFDHRRHAPHGAGCVDCHRGSDRRSAGAAVPLPHKPSCEPCHDGDRAFSVVGTSCRRCHVAPKP